MTGYGLVLTQKYTFGIFIDKATVSEYLVDQAFDLAIRELFREELRKAIGTFL